MCANDRKTCIQANCSEKHRRHRAVLAAAIAVVPFLLIDAGVCSHAASAGPINSGGPVLGSQPIQYEPALQNDGYVPPTAAEMSPMPARYLAELRKIHEPPEMANKPMQARRPASPAVRKISDVMDALGSPDKATHAQRVTAIHKLVGLASDKLPNGFAAMTYGVIAATACLDGENPKAVIQYATEAIGEGGDSTRSYALALRARMYLVEGNKSKALADLEKLMVSDDGRALILGGEVVPPKKPSACDWSIASMDALGDDPRALAAKGLYLSSFISFGHEDKEPKLEARIRSLYTRSERSWHSPIPYYLAAVTLDGLGSEEFTASSKCVRFPPALGGESTGCATHDGDVMGDVRELTMALVIAPKFAPALSARAEKYLELAQGYYAGGKPSLKFFKLAIADFSAAIAVPGADKSELYDDRGLALASVGKYASAAASYIRGMKLAKHGAWKFSSDYQQLAQVYMKMGRFDDAVHTLTQGIMNSSGGLNYVVALSGMRSFRALYPQYDLLPDKILAEDIRRRYEPQFPESWDSTFITNKAKVSSSSLADLYALRGDAYMKAGRRKAALADYARLESDAWSGGPQSPYFTSDGKRDHDVPTAWPGPPPVR